MKILNLPLVLAVIIAMVFVPGCSDDVDDLLNLPDEELVEAGLNEALENTVVPLFDFMVGLGNLLAAAPAVGPRGLVCPDTSGWCSLGTVDCTFTGSSFHFDFDECQAITGEDPLLLDGDIDAVPSGSTVALTLTNLFIDNNPAISGTGTIDILSCDYSVNVNTVDVSIVGTITSCASDPYPTGDQLLITFDDFLMTITLDGSSTASVIATSGSVPVALCTIDLDGDPLTSECNAP